MSCEWQSTKRQWIVFFFSSRRRHTRSKRDWSSDVCSSDLIEELRGGPRNLAEAVEALRLCAAEVELQRQSARVFFTSGRRSEERRVGKECRSRWSPEQ